jgi:hypothetical protein
VALPEPEALAHLLAEAAPLLLRPGVPLTHPVLLALGAAPLGLLLLLLQALRLGLRLGLRVMLPLAVTLPLPLEERETEGVTLPLRLPLLLPLPRRCPGSPAWTARPPERARQSPCPPRARCAARSGALPRQGWQRARQCWRRALPWWSCQSPCCPSCLAPWRQL